MGERRGFTRVLLSNRDLLVQVGDRMPALQSHREEKGLISVAFICYSRMKNRSGCDLCRSGHDVLVQEHRESRDDNEPVRLRLLKDLSGASKPKL